MLLSLLFLTINEPEKQRKVMYLYDHFHVSMVRFAKAKLNGNVHKTEDVVQEAFLRILQRIDCLDFTRSDSELCTYCLTVISNLIINNAQKEHETVALDDQIADETYHLEDAVIDKIFTEYQIREVTEAIKQLDEIYQIVLFHRYAQDMKIADIAELLNIPQSTVKTRLRRAINILIKTLVKEDDPNAE